MFSHLGSHARVEGVLILWGAHLLPPHHLLQAHTVVILEVAHTLPVDMGLNLKGEGKGREECDKKEGKERQGVIRERGTGSCVLHVRNKNNLKIYSNHILDRKVRRERQIMRETEGETDSKRRRGHFMNS